MEKMNERNMINDQDLQQVTGGFCIEEFLNIADRYEASNFLHTQGYGPGTENYEKFMKIWMLVQENQQI